MAQSKHTPGPWAYAGRLGFGYLVDPNIAVAYGGEGSGRTDQGEANARLIAAAPELLAAAKRVLAELNARIEAAPSTAKPVFRGIADLHTAIAKAEGGAP